MLPTGGAPSLFAGRQRGRKIYSLHAHEVECIGKGRAHDEFGVKVSVATTLKRSKGGQFALHAKALPGDPYDGHTLAAIISDMEKTHRISRVLADAGYRGHNAPEATSSGSSPAARNAVSPQPSSARCAGAPRSGA